VGGSGGGGGQLTPCITRTRRLGGVSRILCGEARECRGVGNVLVHHAIHTPGAGKCCLRKTSIWVGHTREALSGKESIWVGHTRGGGGGGGGSWLTPCTAPREAVEPDSGISSGCVKVKDAVLIVRGGHGISGTLECVTVVG